MTDDLVQTLWERAETTTVAFDPADLLVEARRRLMRVRIVRGATAAVAVCAMALGVMLLAPDGRRTDPPVATEPMDTPSYSTGSIIIRDGSTVGITSPVTSYVRVPAGIVLTTGEGRVQLLPARASEATTIGSTSATNPRLVADPAHNQVAWVSRPPGSPAVVVYDVAAGTQRTTFTDSKGRRAADQVRVYAVDGDSVFLRDSRGVVQVDLRTDRAKVLSLSAGDATIGSVAGGRVAWRSPIPSKGYVVGRRFGTGVETGRHTRPMLSAQGTYLSTDDDARVHVQRTRDGVEVTPTLPASYSRAIAYAWSDDDHLLVAGVTSRLGANRVVDLEFLTCSVSTGDCVRTDEGHSYPATLNLPVGDPAAVLGQALGRTPR